jgi:hypothetical protein
LKRFLFLTAIVAVAAAASVALAAKPVKGATYSGTITRDVGTTTFPISFKVTKNGKKVSSFKLADAYPVYCQGGGFPTLGTGGSGRIRHKGTFTVKLPLKAVMTSKPDGSIVVTGRFGAHGSASGKVKTQISGNFGKSCDGTSPFTART